ncbi:MAG TPA: hypothetical protein VMD05_03185 [Candidatus Nanoarchaeia archaeon]|nr:hypothetical protein [Candidatus Nanoarchaeia archaeon]
MKMRTIKLTPKFLIEALQGKAATFASNLPNDTELLDAKLDLSNNQVLAIIRSDSFEDIVDFCPIPEFKITYAVPSKPTSQPNQSLKIEPTPATAIKTMPSTSKPAQPTRAAIKLEGEFSPDQRKLLSFKVEGEFVIVKPTQFLKEEWEDINEVVRSLGGKWMKGDIISFWQIPLQ